MAEILNLNKARKARAKINAETQAAQNRAKFGRTKVDKASDAARADKLKRELDGAKREE
jgi:predicted  nucleic acid-binding Zn-ribbon protein